jgi:hypothetical protein
MGGGVTRPANKDGTYGYTTKQKYEAIVLYKLLGGLSVVSRNTGIPLNTLKDWRATDWWQEMEQEVRSASRAKLTGSIGKVIEKAFVELEDRLHNGDYFYDQKNGAIVRRPIGAFAVNKILNDGIDRSILIEKLAKTEKNLDKKEKIMDRLLQLSEQFSRFAHAKEIDVNLLSEENQNSLHEERPPGLQETDGIPVNPGTDTQEIPEQPSPPSGDR